MEWQRGDTQVVSGVTKNKKRRQICLKISGQEAYLNTFLVTLKRNVFHGKILGKYFLDSVSSVLLENEQKKSKLSNLRHERLVATTKQINKMTILLPGIVKTKLGQQEEDKLKQIFLVGVGKGGTAVCNCEQRTVDPPVPLSPEIS